MPDIPVIFFALANDTTRPLDNLKDEIEGIKKALKPVVDGKLVELVIDDTATTQEILDTFRNPKYRDRIAIFHFAGHADGYTLCVENAEGEPDVADGKGFAEFLGQQQNLQLAFLNACSTQPQVEELLSANVNAVVATSQKISDDVAKQISIEFYRSLATGANLHQAFKEAEASVKMKRGTSVFRGLYWKGQPKANPNRFPWDFYVREGADIIKKWNLPDAAKNPLFGLPELPDIPLPPQPFRYLEWFRKEDAEIFFGRAYQIRDLYELVTSERTSPVIHLFGKSGVGKSSLLAAGLNPRLEGTYHTCYIRRNENLGCEESLREGLGVKAEESIPEAWFRLEKAHGKPLVVILDQLEEIFTRPWKRRYGAELERLLQIIQSLFFTSKRPLGTLILSYRKEYLAEIKDAFQQATIAYEEVFLEKLKREDVMEAVIGLTRTKRTRDKYNLSAEEGLAVLIADDLLEDPDSPIAPMLQVLLSNMWKKAYSINEASPRFSTDLYHKQKKEGLLMVDFLVNQVEILRKWNPAIVDSGLVFDLLLYHTTQKGTATARNLEEIRETYPQSKKLIEEVLMRLQNQYLLIDPKKDTNGQHKVTRLAHDTLAPLVHEQFNLSNTPGQQAKRILNSRIQINRTADSMQVLNGEELKWVAKGERGMRRLSNEEQLLVLCSKAYALAATDPTLAFRLALYAWFVSPNELSQKTLRHAFHSGLFYDKLAISEHEPGRIAFSSDGKHLLVIAWDGSLHLYKEGEDTGQCISRGEGAIWAQFAPDNQTILCVTMGGTIQVMNLNGHVKASLFNRIRKGKNTGYNRGSIQIAFRDVFMQESGLFGVTINKQDGKLYFIKDGYETVGYSLEDIKRQGRRLRLRKLEEGNGQVKMVAGCFSPDGNRVAVQFQEGEIGIPGEVSTQLLLRVLNEHFDEHDREAGIILDSMDSPLPVLDSLRFSHDGSILLGISKKKIFFWHLEEGDGEVTIKEFDRAIADAAFSPDNQIITLSFQTGGTLLLNSKAERLFPLLHGAANSKNYSIVYHPTKSRLYTINEKGVFMWEIKFQDLTFLHTLGSPAYAAAISPQLDKMVLSQGKDLIMRGGGETKTLSQHKDRVLSVAFSSQNNALISVGRDGRIIGWNNDGQHLWNIEGYNRDKLMIEVAKKTYEAIEFENAKDDIQRFVKRWLISLEGHKDTIHSVSFNEAGTKFITASEDGTAKVWSLEGKQLYDLGFWVKDNRIEQVIEENLKSEKPDLEQHSERPAEEPGLLKQLSDKKRGKVDKAKEEFRKVKREIQQRIQGRKVIMGHIEKNEVVRDARIHSQQEIFLLLGRNHLYLWGFDGKFMKEVKISEDENTVMNVYKKQVIIGTERGTLYRWDGESDKVHPFRSGHSDRVNSIHFSNQGTYIVTASSDSTVRIFDATGNLLKVVRETNSGVLQAIPMGDADVLLTTTGDKLSRLWVITVDSILEKSREKKVYQGSKREIKSYGIDYDDYIKRLRKYTEDNL